MYYFAYGANLNRKQMLERCPNGKPRFTASLPNYQLIFAGWSRKWRGGTASIKRFRGERVTGGIYEVSESDLKLLDKHEGADYGRLNVLVITEDGDPLEAATYIRRKQSEETQPSREYLAVIRQGYKEWEIV